MKTGENRAYRFADGSYAENTWAQLSYLGRADWYFFAVNRSMQTGWLHNSGNWYYLNPISDGTKFISQKIHKGFIERALPYMVS